MVTGPGWEQRRTSKIQAFVLLLAYLVDYRAVAQVNQIGPNTTAVILRGHTVS